MTDEKKLDFSKYDNSQLYEMLQHAYSQVLGTAFVIKKPDNYGHVSWRVKDEKNKFDYVENTRALMDEAKKRILKSQKGKDWRPHTHGYSNGLFPEEGERLLNVLEKDLFNVMDGFCANVLHEDKMSEMTIKRLGAWREGYSYQAGNIKHRGGGSISFAERPYSGEGYSESHSINSLHDFGDTPRPSSMSEKELAEMKARLAKVTVR